MVKTARILNGSDVAQKALTALSKRIEALRVEGKTLGLAAVQVGDSKDALLYSRSLEKLLTKLHIYYRYAQFPEKISENDLEREIEGLNKDKQITGVMIFSPLPKHLDYVAVLNAVQLFKDVEGRRILHGFGDRVISPTASAVIKLFEETGIDAAGKEAVVVGHSDVVGKPVAILLLDKMATVTVCHIKTHSLEEHVRRADILIAAAGKPNLIKGKWIKPGAVIIDVGENVLNGKLVGDVEFEEAKNRAGFITPVPGGVGPLTNVMLVKNLLTLAQIQENNGNSNTH